MPSRAVAPMKRALWILAGYALAVGAGVLAVWARSFTVDPADLAASSGMHAFADLVLFLAVAGVVAMAPTWMLLRALPRGERPWSIASAVFLVIGVTALAAAGVRWAALGTASPPGSLLTRWAGVAILRALVAPGFVLANGICALAAPSGKPRRLFVLAAVLEMLGVLGVFAPLLFPTR